MKNGKCEGGVKGWGSELVSDLDLDLDLDPDLRKILRQNDANPSVRIRIPNAELYAHCS